MLAKLKDAEKEIERFRAEKVLAGRRRARRQRRRTSRASPWSPAAVPDGTGADDLRRLVLDVRQRVTGGRPAVVALFTVAGGRPLTVIATNEAARERGIKAGELVRTAAKTLGGGGGGKDDVAQGGGQNPAAVRTRPSRPCAAGRREGLRADTAEDAGAARDPARPPARRGRRGRQDRGRLLRPRRDPRHPGGDRAGPGRARRPAPARRDRRGVRADRGRRRAAPVAQRDARARPRPRCGPSRASVAKVIAPVPVRLVDERMTTVTAAQGLRASGVTAKKGRSVIDQAAAVIILQSALELEKSTGRPGQAVAPGP